MSNATSRGWAVGWAAVIALAATGWLATAASAGTMRHWVCATDGGVFTNNTDGWTGSSSGVPGGIASADCSGLYASRIRGDMTNVAAPIGAGAGITWTYNAPAGTTISTASLNIVAAVYGDDQAASMGVTIYRAAPAYDGDHVLQNCQRFQGCNFLDLNASLYGTKIDYQVNAPAFIAQVACGSGIGAGCAGGFRGELQVHNGYFNLVDDAPPTSSAATGTAVQDAVLRGTETLAFTSNDVGVGVGDVEVRLGDSVVLPRQRIDDNGGHCSPVEGGYLWPIPCKTSVASTLNIDTTKAPDGAQVLTTTIWDAAGNAATAVSRRVTLDNKLPPRLVAGQSNKPRATGDSGVGGTLTATDGLWVEAVSFARQWQVSDDGSTGWKLMPGATAATLRPESGLLGKFVRVAVTASNSEGSATEYSEPRRIEPSNSGGGGVVPKPAPKTAAELVADNGSGGDPKTGKLVPARKRTSASVDYGDPVRIEGRLTDAAGRPLTGAQIDVWQQVKVRGSARVKVASITSDKQGRYSYKPEARSNRTVELSYCRQRGAAIYQSTQALRLQVRAGMRLRADRTSIPSFGRVTLRGRVLSSDLPAQGVVVQVRARDSGRWLKVGNPRTNAKGQFSWTWKFAKVAHGVVPFQVRVLRTGDLPAMTNQSRTVRVRIG